MPGEKAPERERREQILAAAFRVAKVEGLGGVTSRRVAAEADLSVGSILFHFGTMESLVLSLLDWWLDRLAFPVTQCRSADGDGAKVMAGLLEREILRIARDPASAELFFDFWRLGVHSPEIRTRIRGELQRYRSTFEEIAASDPSSGMHGDCSGGVAALAVALIQGYAVQAAIDPDAISDKQYLELAATLIRGAVAHAAGTSRYSSRS